MTENEKYSGKEHLRDKQIRMSSFPEEIQILNFIKNIEGKVNQRDIARAFFIQKSDRSTLTAMLEKMSEEGKISKHKKHATRSDILPSVTPVEMHEDNKDGQFVALPHNGTNTKSAPVSRLNRKRTRIRNRSQQSDAVPARFKKQGIQSKRTHQPVAHTHLKPHNTQILGVFQITPDGCAYIKPTNRKILQSCLIKNSETLGAQPGELVSATIHGSGRRRMARARILETHGKIHGPRSLPLIALQEHDIPDIFTDAAMSEAKVAQYASLTEKMTDLRHIPFITIDPEDARDHDDAVWAETDSDPGNADGVVVIVAIADVAHYVRSGSAMDSDARLRGNSVYFPGYVIPMLPERISNDLCSLRSGESRSVLAVRMVFDSNGQKKHHKFMRAMIKSKAALSYENAQDIIDGKSPIGIDDPCITKAINALWNAHKTLGRGRKSRTPLEIELPERKIILGDDGGIEQIVIPPRLDTHRLIEEFMIQANVSAAETLEAAKITFLYRVHNAPSKIKTSILRTFLSSLKIKQLQSEDLATSHFNTLLKQVKNTEYEIPIQELVLRTQSQAEYAITNNYGHFGLNLPLYAHFTSPIRRYSDLIVHRILISVLNLGTDELDNLNMDRDELKDIASSISTTERRAMAAERDTMGRLIAHHLEDKIDTFFEAIISGATRAGLFVRLLDNGADGFIPRRKIGGDNFRHDEQRQALIGVVSGKIHRIGDKVRVRLVEVSPLAGNLCFDLFEENSNVSPKLRNTINHSKTSRASTRGKSGSEVKSKKKSRDARRNQSSQHQDITHTL